MEWQLRVTAGADQDRVFPLTESVELVAGRHSSAAICLSDPHVSRSHCRLEVTKDKVMVTDLKSAVGTRINGERIDRSEFKTGDVLNLGLTELRLELRNQKKAPSTAEAVVIPPDSEPGVNLASLPGKRFANFVVGSVLAHGKTGVIFRASEVDGAETLALKVLYHAASHDEEAVQRFIRAIKTMLPLRHPHLVTIYGAGKTQGHCWLAMEYVPGESLKQIIERKSGTSAALRKQKKAGSEPRLRALPLAGTEGLSRSWWVPALRIGIHISRALDYAYENSLIHRNVTPQNILIRSHDKFTKLGDLILAKALEGPLAANLTCPRTLLGELHYMAPERTRGSQDLDCRSDIYGLGAALYALLTGQPPYEGGSLDETMERIRRGSLTTFKEHGLAVPESMERTVLKMLAGDPEDRYQTPAELLARLERIAAEEQVTC